MIETIPYTENIFEFKKDSRVIGSAARLKIKDYYVIGLNLYEDYANSQDLKYMLKTLCINFDCEEEDIKIDIMKHIKFQ